MYKVFPVEGGYQIFWCPHYRDGRTQAEKLAERQPYNSEQTHPSKSAAYRKCKELNNEMEEAHEYDEAEAELERRSKEELLNKKLTCWIQPNVMERLQEFVEERQTSINVAVNLAIQAMLYDQGY